MKHRALAALTVALGTTVLAAAPALAAPTSYPNDYFFAKGDQWALVGATSSIQSPAAWCTSTGAGKVVAMIDTGADFSHPDLQGKLKPGVAFTGGNATTANSWTASGQDAVTDHNGHGTVTTGVVVADTNNGQGIAAVAPDATALVVEVQGSDGSIYENDVAAAMEWAADNNRANVINVSIAPGQISASRINVPDLTIPTAATYAAQKGVAVVLSAGNDNSSQAVYPNMQGTALVVGALTPSGTMSSYSNHGSDVSIYAPGGSTLDPHQMTIQNSIVSTDMQSSGYQYAMADGTSLSAPMVSGTLALLMAHNMTGSAAMQAVTSSAVTRNGLKELDAAAALGVPDSQRCGTPSTPPAGTPPPLVQGGGGGPVTTSTSTAQHTTTTTTIRITTTTRQTQVTSSASTLTTDTAPGTPSPGELQTGGAGDAGKGGHQDPLPPAKSPSPGGGGVPTPLVIVALVALVAGGAPLGARLINARRGRGVGR
jgi:hypothetical protein